MKSQIDRCYIRNPNMLAEILSCIGLCRSTRIRETRTRGSPPACHSKSLTANEACLWRAKGSITSNFLTLYRWLKLLTSRTFSMRGAKETLQALVGRLCVLADPPALQDRQVRHHPGPAFVFDRILEYKTGNKRSKSSRENIWPFFQYYWSIRKS